MAALALLAGIGVAGFVLAPWVDSPEGLLGLALLVLAMARPQKKWEQEKIKADAVDIVLSQELANAKTYLTGSYALQLSSTSRIARNLALIKPVVVIKSGVARQGSITDAADLDQTGDSSSTGVPAPQHTVISSVWIQSMPAGAVTFTSAAW